MNYNVTATSCDKLLSGPGKSGPAGLLQVDNATDYAHNSASGVYGDTRANVCFPRWKGSCCDNWRRWWVSRGLIL